MEKETISSQNISKEMAYLLGVYLTDGSISKENKFQLQVIDKDFAERTLICIRKIKPSCKANVYIRDATENGGWNKQVQYCINAGFTEWKEFFEKQTGNKNFLPTVVLDASLVIKKWFIAGIMDGDGYISKHTGKSRVQYTIGIGKIESGWIMEFKTFLTSLGINIYKPYRYITKGGYPFMTFNINIADFLNRGLFFTIERKQKKLDDLREAYGGSETKRCASRTDEDIVQR